MSEGKSFHIGR